VLVLASGCVAMHRVGEAARAPIATLHLDSRENAVNPREAVHTDLLVPGTYVVRVTGPGIRYGASPAGHWCFVWAWSQVSSDPSRCIGLNRVGEEVTITLEHGGWIGAFVIDSYVGDNAGCLDLTVNRR
jgi:hypothetical protein